MDITTGQFSKGYAVTFFRAIDIFFATLIWRDYNVTISSMCGLELRKPQPAWWAVLIGRKFLERFWPGHCEKAIIADRLRNKQGLVILGDPCNIHS